MKKIHCPAHDDKTPSLHVYEEYSHCFSCGYHVRNDKIGIKNAGTHKKPPTDVKQMVRYIQNLPVKRIRGLEFHYDSSGFYIVWPDLTYFKRRNTDDNPVRYSGPTGVKPPLLVYPGKSSVLVVTEGEINVLTLHTIVCPEHTLCSPGSASEFKRHVKEYLKYDEIVLILDHDAAGIAFGLEVKEILLKAGKKARLVTVQTDYNDLLQERGPEAVKLQFERDMK